MPTGVGIFWARRADARKMPGTIKRRMLRGYQLVLACGVLQAAWQPAVDRALSGVAGSAVVLDVRTGRTLAARGADLRLPPGSTVKPFTLLALRESGRVKQGTAIVCRRKLTLMGRRLDCTHPVPPSPLDAVAALAYSCNWFFATLGNREVSEALRRAGFQVLAPADAEQASAQAVGEWGISVTPLELARAYRRLALGPPLPGLEAAAEYGTARLAQPEGVRVAGKTGTTVHEGRRYGWFAGYAPAEAPQVVVVVLAAQGSGGGDAAPIARRIFEANGAEGRALK